MRKPLDVLAAEAHKASDSALDAERKAIALAFPIGSVVEWEHGSVRCATVIGHSEWSRDLIVESVTGKKYRVDAWRVLHYRGLV